MDAGMPALIARTRVPVVCMHFYKSIHPMPRAPEYADLFGEILAFFGETMGTAEAAGVRREQMILDPGIGFGKSLEDHLKIISGLSFLNKLDRPVLVGPSRKSFIEKITGLDSEQRLEGTAAAAAFCLINGAHILRVHDVQFFHRFAMVMDRILSAATNA
jgi:dihydropteroate synthase